MKRKKKYMPGDYIVNHLEFYLWTTHGGWVYWKGRPKHPTFIWSMPYRTVAGLIDKGVFRKAILNTKEV